jgi:hypothetical protein
MLDCKEDDSNSDQELYMLDNLHGEISGNTRRMMDQQFAYFTHASIGEDFMSLGDTLNNVLRQLEDTVAFDPAQEVEAPQPHKDVALYDPILQAQTIEAPYQTPVDLCLEGAQGGTECVSTMEVNETDYCHPDALISDHPAVTNFLQSQGRTMNYRAAFNTVKKVKAFFQEHFNSLDLQAVYHPHEHHCATATWGGKAKDAHICIIKAPPGLFQVQSQMHAQQGQEVLLSQRKAIKASLIIVAQQGSDTQMGATKGGHYRGSKQDLVI